MFHIALGYNGNQNVNDTDNIDRCPEDNDTAAFSGSVPDLETTPGSAAAAARRSAVQGRQMCIWVRDNPTPSNAPLLNTLYDNMV